MKIYNPIKAYFHKIHEERIASINAEINKTVNANIIIANDKNDPDNRIYIFCNGVPVMEVADDSVITNGTVNINEVSEVLGKIKSMYRNYLNNKPIK